MSRRAVSRRLGLATVRNRTEPLAIRVIAETSQAAAAMAS